MAPHLRSGDVWRRLQAEDDSLGIEPGGAQVGGSRRSQTWAAEDDHVGQRDESGRVMPGADLAGRVPTEQQVGDVLRPLAAKGQQRVDRVGQAWASHLNIPDAQAGNAPRGQPAHLYKVAGRSVISSLALRATLLL